MFDAPHPCVYIAGPDVFMPEANRLAAAKKALCKQFGFAGLHPLDNALPPGLAPSAMARAIYDGNRAMMDRAEAVIANLTPFRGPSADAGTVFELGYMAGRGRAVLGYSTVAGPYRARVPDAVWVSGQWVDGAGEVVEDFGLADNLMIEYTLPGLVVPGEEAGRLAGAALHLWCFERCLQQLALRRGLGVPLSLA